MAANINTEFCRELLKATRRDAKQAGVEIPRIYCMRLGGDYIEVRGPVNGQDDIIWEGGADNCYEAKANAIEVLIERAHLSKFVPLESVGSLIDPETGTIYPQHTDETPDLCCGVDVEEVLEAVDRGLVDWCSALSSADATVISAIVQALNRCR